MDLNGFRSSYQQFLMRARCEQDVEAWLDIYWSRLPPFPEGQFVQEDIMTESYAFRGAVFSSRKRHCEAQLVTDAAVSQCVGYTWLFCNDHTTGRPLPERLAACLYRSPDTVPTFFATRMGDYYLCGDGNHRIYAAYLLDRPVKIVVDSYCERLE